MKLIPVDSVPKRCGKHHLQDMIKEFVNGDDKIVRIDFSKHDYKSARICRSCIGSAVKRSGHPIRVSIRGNEVFMQKI